MARRRMFKRKYNRTRNDPNKRINRVIERRTEKKYVDVDWRAPPTGSQVSVGNCTSISNVPVIYNVTAIGDGPDRFNRIGRKITLKSFRFKGSFYNGTSALFSSDLNNEIRILLLKCKRGFDVNTITALQLFTNAPSSYTRAMVNTDLFTVMYDKTKHCYVAAEDGNGLNRAYVPAQYDFSVKLRNMQVQYNAGTASTPSKGQLILVAISDSNVIPHVVAGSCNFRIKFYDM